MSSSDSSFSVIGSVSATPTHQASNYDRDKTYPPPWEPPPWRPPRHRQQQQRHHRHRQHRRKEQRRACCCPQRSTNPESVFQSSPRHNAPTGEIVGDRHTSLMSLPSSSERSFSRRSSSASIPTESRTDLMSSAEGEELPPRPRRRYAARCFILYVCESQETAR